MCLYGEEYEERSEEPLTSGELKERLKHIAGLCWGLVCDIGTMDIENKVLQERVVQLVNELNEERKKNGKKPIGKTYANKTDEEVQALRERRKAAAMKGAVVRWGKKNVKEGDKNE